MKFILDDTMMATARKIASMRQQGKNFGQWANNHNSDDTHLIGVVGELMVAHALGLPMDYNYYSGGDGGIDFVAPPLVIEVKAVSSAGYRFSTYTPRYGDIKFDIGVLCAVDLFGRSGLIKGWTTKTHFISQCKVEDLGNGKRLIIDNDRLMALPSLIKLLEKLK